MSRHVGVKLTLKTLSWEGINIAKRPYKQGLYSKQEIAILKKGYPAVSAVTLAAKVKRSLVSVQRQLRKMGIGRRKSSGWTHAQLKLLRRMYRDAAIWQIANRLDKTPSEIKRKAADLHLKK
jgi:hypothetical protein